jgi:hypothetical protein
VTEDQLLTLGIQIFMCLNKLDVISPVINFCEKIRYATFLLALSRSSLIILIYVPCKIGTKHHIYKMYVINFQEMKQICRYGVQTIPQYLNLHLTEL